MRTITLEEHFVSPGFIAGPGREFIEQLRNTGARGAKIFEQLQDVGDGRIAEMDAAGIDMQVLSLNSPGIEQADVAEQVAIAREFERFPRGCSEEKSKALCSLCLFANRGPRASGR